MLIVKDAPLRKKILEISVPAMSEMSLYMIIGVVDIAVVGRLGAAPLAAVGLGAEIFFAVVLLMVAVAVGSSVLVAQAKGAGRMEYAAQVAGKSVIIALIIGIVTAICGLVLAGPILKLFPLEPDVHRYTMDYLRIAFWVSPAAIVYYMINSIFRGLGRTDLPMKIAVVTNIINCVGDYVLVYGVLGFPEMGVAGAAAATSASHAVGLLLSGYILFTGRSGLKVNGSHVLTADFMIIRDIFRLGIPSMIEDLFRKSADILVLFLIMFLGTAAFASHEVAFIVESISFMPGVGVALAATAMVGHAVGARNEQEALRASRGCLELASLGMGFIGLCFALFPYYIASIFTSDADIIQTAGFLIRIAALEQLTIAATMVLDGILKGSGDTRTPMFITALFIWLLRLPVLYLIICVLQLSIFYVWAFFVTDWALRTLVFAVIYRRRIWLKKALQEPLIAVN